MGGYFLPDFSPNNVIFGPDSPLARRYDLLGLAARTPPPVALWLETSREDDLSYPTSAQLLAEVRSPLSVRADVLDHGGHRFGVWEGMLPDALSWLGHNVPGFAPR